MQRIGIRRLRADVAGLVRRAGAGEHIVVTVHGHAVAELIPAGDRPTPPSIDDLVARAMVEPPRRRDAYTPGAPVPVWHGTRLDRALRVLRG